MTVIKFKNPQPVKRGKQPDPERNVWKFANNAAGTNIDNSIGDWEAVEKDPNHFPKSTSGREYAAACWRHRAKHAGQFEISLKVGTTKVLLANYDKGFDKTKHDASDYYIVSNKEDVADHLQQVKTALTNLSKDDGELGEAMYLVGKKQKCPDRGKNVSGKGVGATRTRENKPKQTLYFEDDIWEWRDD